MTQCIRFSGGKTENKEIHAIFVGQLVSLRNQNNSCHGGAHSLLPIVTSGFHSHGIWRGSMSGNGNQATPLCRVVGLDPRRSMCDLLRHHLSYEKYHPITWPLMCFHWRARTFLAGNSLKNANSNKKPGFLVFIKIKNEKMSTYGSTELFQSNNPLIYLHCYLLKQGSTLILHQKHQQLGPFPLTWLLGDLFF